MDKIPLTIVEAAAALRAGSITSRELTDRLIERADRLDGLVESFAERYSETARSAASEADAAFAAGIDRGPLQGIPLAMKDVISTEEGPPRGGSQAPIPLALKGDAEAVRGMRAQGAVMLGKSVTMEFAIGMPDHELDGKVSKNPWNLDVWAGGSSSGSGAGIAAQFFYGSLGSDTGGSIRCPAAFCGVTGLKPTFGLVPTAGIIPLSFSLDHVSPMARSAQDCAVLLDAAVATAPLRSGLHAPRGDYLSACEGDLRGVRIGVERAHHLGGPQVDPGVREAFEQALVDLADAGAVITDVVIPLYDEVVGATMIITDTEAYALHRHVLRTNWKEYGTSTRVQIAAGAAVPSADYLQAQRVRAMGQVAIRNLFTDCDLVVSPTAAIPALPTSYLYDSDLRELILSRIYTPIWDGLGNPAMSVPMGFTGSGLPVGLQIAGRHLEDALVLRAGHVYQQLTAWHRGTPQLGEAQ